MRNINKLLMVIILAVTSITVNADYLEVRRSANIYEDPSSKSTLISKAKKDELLGFANDGKQTNGYYSVIIPETQEKGWVYRTRVKRIKGEISTEGIIGSEIGFDGAVCGKHLMYGIPHKSDQVLCREGYAAGYNYTYKLPDWTAYHITLESAHGANYPRLDNFRVDRQLAKTYRSGGSDYSKSGYDRGHMAPSAAIDFSRKANDETFLYSNMTPQLAGFNRNMMGHTGIWGEVEDRVREWVRDREELYIIAGTYFEQPVKTIGRGVGVPNAFYKIIYDPVKIESIAFWMKQDLNTAHQINKYITSIDSIEAKTGYDFLSKISPSVQVEVESKKVNIEHWEK